jgi:hypothetical protein
VLVAECVACWFVFSQCGNSCVDMCSTVEKAAEQLALATNPLSDGMKSLPW